MRPDLRNIHSIPAGKVDAAVLDKITVPDAYPHFTPFVENKSQVRVWQGCTHAALLWTWDDRQASASTMGLPRLCNMYVALHEVLVWLKSG
jgi:hypothetical protein